LGAEDGGCAPPARDLALLCALKKITGNGIDVPIGLVFAPWGELFVVNQGDASLSRFTFDDAQQAVPNGNFALEVAAQAGIVGVGWTLIAPAPP
jgi:hypothetical protein